jgi:threonine aldolase
MRQAGVLAAAGIVALTDMARRLHKDRERAKNLARFLAEIPGVALNIEDVQINMAYFTAGKAQNPETNAGIVDVFAKAGVRVSPANNGVFRFAAYYWIGDQELKTVKRVRAGGV